MAEHNHNHTHGRGRHRAQLDYSAAFAIGIALNTVFVIVQAASGVLANSMALLADAAHNLSDVLSLLMAWAASMLVRRAPTPRYTYGLRSSSILAALGNAVVLLLAVGAIAWEAIHRLASPQHVAGTPMIVVALVGIAINGGTAWLFRAGRDSDLNVRAAFVHMLADAAISLGVVVSGVSIVLLGWLWIDPLLSLVIATIIVWGTWGVLGDAMNLALHAVPFAIDPSAVRRYLEQLEGVSAIHDLHVWAMSTTETALTCHLVMPQTPAGDAFLAQVAKELHDRFAIAHATLQIERGDHECALEPDHVV